MMASMQIRAEQIEDRYSLSPLQEGLLFHTVESVADGMYLDQIGFYLNDVRLEAFRDAWQHVIDRHPILRTSFHWEDLPAPVQMVHTNAILPLDWMDWRSTSPDDLKPRLEEFQIKQRSIGFDLTKPPLMRVTVIQLGENRCYCHWTWHHLISDGWSSQTVVHDFTSCYRAILSGQTVTLPPRRPYRDFIDWLHLQKTDQAEPYWRDLLAGFSEPTRLAAEMPHADHARSASQQEEYEVLLDARLAGALTSTTRRHHLTLSTVVHGAWGLVLSHHSGGSKDVLFGSVVSGRPPELTGVESIVGPFINTIPLRVRITGHESLLVLFERLQRQMVESRKYEFTPMARLKAWSDVSRRDPLFESIVAFENYSGVQLSGGDADHQPVERFDRVSYPLAVVVFPGRPFVIHLSYDPQRYSSELIRRLVLDLERVLRCFAGAAGYNAQDCLMPTDEEQAQLTVQLNETAREVHQCSLLEQVKEVAEERGGEVAVRDEEEEVRYEELVEEAEEIGERLREKGVGAEVMVGVMGKRSARYGGMMLGVWESGGVYVPLDEEGPVGRTASLLKRSGCRVVLSEKRCLGKVEELKKAVEGLEVVWREERKRELGREEEGRGEGKKKRRRREEESGKQLAYVFYTSGSTGEPKGVLVEQEGMRNHVWAKVETLGLKAGDVVAQNAAQSFDVSVWQMMSAWVVGGRVEVVTGVRSRDGRALLEAVREGGVTVLEVVPSQLRGMLSRKEELPKEMPELKWLYVMGEVFEPRLYEEWRERYPQVRVVNGYGATECSDDVMQWEVRGVGEGKGKRLPVGKALRNLQVYVVEESSGRRVGWGVVGEIYVGGVGVGRGYQGEARRTAEQFVPDGWSGKAGGRVYRTGDRGLWNEAGELEFVGRRDEQVKVRGHRVEPGEVEGELRRLEGVREAAVVVREERLVAFVEGDGVESEGLRAQLRERLPDYLVPAVVVRLEELPRTAGGKLDRPRLPATPVVERETEEGERPQNGTEEVLAGIWAEILGVSHVGRQDNFFELGGDSILTIQIAARARQLGIRLNPRHIFEYPTVARLSAVAHNFKQSEMSHTNDSGAVSLTPIQRWFFELDSRSWHHYNMSVILEVPAGIDLTLLGRAISHLITHHDQLRAYFTRDDSGWHQTIVPAVDPGADVLLNFDVSSLGELARALAIEREADELQAKFDLSSPPLLRAAYFNCGPEQPGRLLLIIHHLIVDAFSLSILLEDLRTAYGQLVAGKPMMLPAKTTSFKTWAERLQTESTMFAGREANFWREEVEKARSSARLPRHGQDQENVVGSTGSVVTRFDRSTTRLLLQKLPQVYGTNISVALLAALGRSMARWTSSAQVSIDVEGHGREPFSPDIDLSRSVGWFTTITPLTFDASPERPLQQVLIAVKERHNRQQRRGLGYGVLRYMAPDEGLKAALTPLNRYQVSFNYLGQSDRLLPDAGSFGLAKERPGSDQNPTALRPHLLAVSAHVSEDMLTVEWNYSNRCHPKEMVEMLAADCGKEIRDIASLCHSAQHPVRTPSDFPFVALEEESFERIVQNYGTVEEIFPLGPLHEGLLFESLSREDARVYIEQFTFTLTSRDVNPAAIEDAWQHVLDRHSTLRAAFVMEGLREGLMVVKPRVLLPIAHQDWRSLDPSALDDQWREFLQGDRERGFRTTEAPLMRLAVIQTGDYEYRIVWSFHHLLLDGWSASIVLNEVFALLSSARRGQKKTLPPAPSYREYSAWLNHQDSAASEKFWRRTLTGFSVPTPVPFSSGERSSHGEFDLVTRKLADETVLRLRRFAARHQVTLNTIVQGAYALLLSEHSGNEDVVFGATLSGRPGEVFQIDKMVGLFINTLPRRVNVRRDERLVPWLMAIQRDQVDLSAHQHISLAQVQQWSDVPRGVRLFDTIINFANYPIEREAFQNAEFIGVQQSELHGFTEYAITLTVAVGTDIDFALKFDCSQLDGGSAKEILKQLCAVLDAITIHEAGRLLDIKLLDDQESARIFHEWTGSETNGLATVGVHEFFERQVSKTPYAVALIHGQRQLTFDELNRRANRLARYLLHRGVSREDIVGLWFDRGMDMIVAALAVLKAGAAFLPLESESPEARLLERAEDCAASLVLSNGSFDRERLLGKVADSVGFIDCDEDKITEQSEANLALRFTSHSLASIVYTSHSSTTSRAVMVEHQQFANYMSWAQGVFNLSRGSGVLMSLPFGVGTTSAMALASLVSGQALVIVSGRNVAEALCDAVSTRPDFTALTVTRFQFGQLQAELEHSQMSLLSGTLILTGDNVDRTQLAHWREHAPNLRTFIEYGLAETTAACCVHQVTQEDVLDRSVPSGRPMAGVRAYVLSEIGALAAPGVEGDLYVGGSQVSRGYLKNARTTAERFLPDPFSCVGGQMHATGDRARWRSDGQLEYRGPKENRDGGRESRIACDKIERVLRRHKDVIQCVVDMDTSKGQGAGLVAYVVPRPGSRLNVRELRSHLKSRLEKHLVVSTFIRLESLPLAVDGDIDRSALRAQATWDDDYAGLTEPETDWEIRLAVIWRDLFESKQIGIDQDFFELGGHSLLALRMVTRIRHEFGMHLPLTTLAESRTIRRTAALLARGHAAGSLEPLVPIQPNGSRLPFYCVHPIGGSVFRFFELARCLGPEQPFFGVQAPDLLQAVPNKSIEEYASEYRKAIVKANPGGPYLIGGYSFGGLVAFEIAQQLIREGRQVALLCLLDTHSPHEQRKIPDPDDPLLISILIQSHGRMDGHHINLQASDIAAHSPVDQFPFVFRQLKRAGLFDADIPDDMGAQYLQNALTGYKARSQAARRYSPTVFPGQITLFRSQELEPGTRDLAERFGLDLEDETYGWRKFSTEPVAVHIVPGVHERLCHQPNVRTLASRLTECFAAASRGQEVPHIG